METIMLRILLADDHEDRKSTRLNSSHDQISYAVFCLKKKTHESLGDYLRDQAVTFFVHQGYLDRRQKFAGEAEVLVAAIPVHPHSAVRNRARPKHELS